MRVTCEYCKGYVVPLDRGSCPCCGAPISEEAYNRKPYKPSRYAPGVEIRDPKYLYQDPLVEIRPMMVCTSDSQVFSTFAFTTDMV